MKIGNDAWIEGCYFDVYAEDRGEPAKKFDMPDYVDMLIDCGGLFYFAPGPQDVGNLQIHSGLKS